MSAKTACDVLVIGGSAAGMMAALQAAWAGASVILLEQNEKLGKKIYITGKGRCNVTNTVRNGNLHLKYIRIVNSHLAERFLSSN